MNKIEISGHTEIYYAGKKCTYVLGALINEKNNYTMPWLYFIKDYGVSNEKFLDSWDNPDYLLIFYNDIIKPWVEDKTIKDSEEFQKVLKEEFISLDDFEGIYELFNRSFEIKLLK